MSKFVSFVAALVCAVLLAAPAQAGAVTTAVALIANGVSFGAALTASFGAFGAFLIKAAIGIVFNVAAQMLAAPKEKVRVNGIQTEQTTTGDVTPQKIIVGRYATEGHLVAPAYTHGPINGKLTYIIELSNAPIEGLTGRIAIDGAWYDIEDTPGKEHADYGWPILGLTSPVFGNVAWIKWYDGTQTTADAMLVAKYGAHADRPWTSDHILKGTAYAIMTFQYAEGVFSSLPTVRFEVDGAKLYDPRKDTTVGGSGTHRWNNTATWKFTRNPQVISYNILRGITLPTSDIYGGQVPEDDLPLDDWFAAMNECDVDVDGRAQFVAGFEIDVTAQPQEIITELNKASFTQLSQFGGVFRPRTGAPAAPVLSITDDDLLVTKSGELTPFPDLASTYNEITGTYVEPASIYQGTQIDPIRSTEWETADGDRRLSLDMGLPAVTDVSQATHLLTSYIRDERRFVTHRVPLSPVAGLIEPLDTISWTSVQNGYTSKLFEVVAVEDAIDTGVIMLTIRERDPDDTDWSSEDDISAPDGNLGSTDITVPSLTLIASEEVRFYRNQAQNVVVINSSVTDGDDYIGSVEVEYKLAADSDYIPLGSGRLGDFIIPDLLPGTYDFRARAVTTWGLAGDWTEEDNFVVDFLPDNRGLWNGRFASGDFTGWTKEEYDGSGDGDAAEMSVVQRNAASDEDALKYAPTLNVVKLDLGWDAYTGGMTRLIWNDLVPVEPGRDVVMSFRHAAGDGSTYSNPTPGNGGLVRGVLRWYDEDGVQLSAPDDETDDQEVPNIAPSVGVNWWKTWSRTGQPPEGAAFCKPVFECSGGAGLSFLADFIVDSGLQTGQLAQDSVSFVSSVTFGSTSLASDGVEEMVVDDTAEVSEINTGSSGESHTIHATLSGNLSFTTPTSMTCRLYIDSTLVAATATNRAGSFYLAGATSKSAGDYGVEFKATAADASEVTITEGAMVTTVLKR